MTARRTRGDHVLFRDVYEGRIRAIIPMTVVEDTRERTVLYLAVGTPFMLPANADDELTRDVVGFHHLTELRWEGFEQLLIIPAQASHAVIARWSGRPRRLVEWYINLQAPLRTTHLGFDTTDHALDLIISADRTGLQWKDTEQLSHLVERGYFTQADSNSFYAEAERVVAAAGAGLPPFTDGWERWRPDPTWPLPDLPSEKDSEL